MSDGANTQARNSLGWSQTSLDRPGVPTQGAGGEILHCRSDVLLESVMVEAGLEKLNTFV